MYFSLMCKHTQLFHHEHAHANLCLYVQNNSIQKYGLQCKQTLIYCQDVNYNTYVFQNRLEFKSFDILTYLSNAFVYFPSSNLLKLECSCASLVLISNNISVSFHYYYFPLLIESKSKYTY